MELQTPTPTDPELSFANAWGLVEIMGHDQIAGRLSKLAFGGAALLSVTVPDLPATEEIREKGNRFGEEGEFVTDAMEAIPGYTKLFGVAAIFSIRMMSEEAVFQRLQAGRDKRRRFVLSGEDEPRALPAPVHFEDEGRDYDPDDPNDI